MRGGTNALGTCPEIMGYKKWPSNLQIRLHMTVLPAPCNLVQAPPAGSYGPQCIPICRSLGQKFRPMSRLLHTAQGKQASILALVIIMKHYKNIIVINKCMSMSPSMSPLLKYPHQEGRVSICLVHNCSPRAWHRASAQKLLTE